MLGTVIPPLGFARYERLRVLSGVAIPERCFGPQRGRRLVRRFVMRLAVVARLRKIGSGLASRGESVFHCRCPETNPLCV
jgi:hypothetical protein